MNNITRPCPACQGHMTIAYDELDALVNHFGSNDAIVCQECQDTIDIDNMSVSDLNTYCGLDFDWATGEWA